MSRPRWPEPIGATPGAFRRHDASDVHSAKATHFIGIDESYLFPADDYCGRVRAPGAVETLLSAPNGWNQLARMKCRTTPNGPDGCAVCDYRLGLVIRSSLTKWEDA